MAAHKGRAKVQTHVDRRRALVLKLYFGEGVPFGLIVQRLAAIGIRTSKSAVHRDAMILRREFAAITKDFDALASIGEASARFRAVYGRAMRSAIATKDNGERARLLKVCVNAVNSEVALLQSCGLLPKDLGMLRIASPPADHAISAEEIRRILDEARIDDRDLISEAENAWRYGDVPTERGGGSNGNGSTN